MYAVVRTDKMFGTDNRAGLVSVRFKDADGKYADIENGNVVKLGGLDEGTYDVYEGKAPKTGDSIKDIVLIASPEVMYDERKRNLDEFINKAGLPARGYRLHTGDVFSVTIEALDAKTEPHIGDGVKIGDGTKICVADAISSDGASGESFGKILDINVVGRHKYYAIQVD